MRPGPVSEFDEYGAGDLHIENVVYSIAGLLYLGYLILEALHNVISTSASSPIRHFDSSTLINFGSFTRRFLNFFFFWFLFLFFLLHGG